MIKNLANYELFYYVIIGWSINILLLYMAKRQLRNKKYVDWYTKSALFSFGLLTVFFTIYLLVKIIF